MPYTLYRKCFNTTLNKEFGYKTSKVTHLLSIPLFNYPVFIITSMK